MGVLNQPFGVDADFSDNIFFPKILISAIKLDRGAGEIFKLRIQNIETKTELTLLKKFKI